jgi:ACS family hexuronate transporter-like MFS transporter
MTKTVPKATGFRWVICSLLFFATAVNYLDRQVLSLTWKDLIAPTFHWTDDDYGTITATFALVYAFCNLFAGKFIDRLGTKKGYLWAIFVWSLAACAHALCGWGVLQLVTGIESVEAMKNLQAGSSIALAVSSISVWLFLGCRAFLALGEAGNFPAAVKVTAEYFPKKDRAFATSIFNSGSSVGALAAPLTIPLIARLW